MKIIKVERLSPERFMIEYLTIFKKIKKRYVFKHREYAEYSWQDNCKWVGINIGQLLNWMNRNNVDKIENINVSIVQGRYDFICPPSQAFRLHSRLKKSLLNITNAGHSSSDTENKKTLISELRRITTTT